MQIHNLQSITDDVYFEHDFKLLLESHLTYLKETDIRLQVVTEHQNYKYEGDFYGLLDDIGIPKNLHYITMRVNDYEHSGDYKGDIYSLVLPSYQTIEQLRNVYQTKNAF